MQVFQRLFKTANDTTTSSPSISKKETANNQKVKSKDIVLFGICRGSTRRRGDNSKSRSKTFNIFKALCRNKDISQEYFYSTIHLRRVGSNSRRQHFEYCMNMKNKSLTRGLSISHKAADSIGHTQVLPITDSASSSSSSSSSRNDKARCSNGEKKDEKAKGDKAKTISKMKELLRWAAAAKSEKGRQYIGRKVFNNFRNRTALKAVAVDDQMSNESPKISFRWEVESCSTTCSAYSAISMPASLTKNDQSFNINFPSVKATPLHIDQCPAAAAAAGKLNWITSDSEFVVLEL